MATASKSSIRSVSHIFCPTRLGKTGTAGSGATGTGAYDMEIDAQVIGSEGPLPSDTEWEGRYGHHQTHSADDANRERCERVLGVR